MKSILEQNFDELYAQITERVKCIQPVVQLDTFTKFMMFETLNQILYEVFGASRFMYMIRITDTTFVVSFLDRYKSQTTNNLIVPFKNEFMIPDKETILNMSLEELTEFFTQLKKNGLSFADIANQLSVSKKWFYSLMKDRRRGRMPRQSAKFREHIADITRRRHISRISSMSEHFKTSFAVALRLNEQHIPVVPILFKHLTLNERQAVSRLKTHYGCSDNKEYYNELINSTTKEKVDGVYIDYCKLLIDVLNYNVRNHGYSIALTKCWDQVRDAYQCDELSKSITVQTWVKNKLTEILNQQKEVKVS